MIDSKYFNISVQVSELFPEIKTAIAIIHGVTVSSSSSEQIQLTKGVVDKARQELSSEDLAKEPRIQDFRRIYKKFGIKASSRRPSAEALLRRVLKPENELYAVNSIVDSYNTSSIEYRLPMAAYDLSRISFPISIRLAKENESHRGIGSKVEEPVKANTLVYADSEKILCREYNYRDSELSKVSSDTTSLVVFIDGGASVSSDVLSHAMHTTASRIVTFNGGNVEYIGVTE